LRSLTNAFGVIAATSYAPILSGSTGQRDIDVASTDVATAHTNGDGGESFALIDDDPPIENFSPGDDMVSATTPTDTGQSDTPSVSVIDFESVPVELRRGLLTPSSCLQRALAEGGVKAVRPLMPPLRTSGVPSGPYSSRPPSSYGLNGHHLPVAIRLVK